MKSIKCEAANWVSFSMLLFLRLLLVLRLRKLSLNSIFINGEHFNSLLQDNDPNEIIINLIMEPGELVGRLTMT